MTEKMYVCEYDVKVIYERMKNSFWCDGGLEEATKIAKKDFASTYESIANLIRESPSTKVLCREATPEELDEYKNM